MSKPIDPHIRPTSYFRPLGLERYMLSRVKGAILRRKLQRLFDAGRHNEAHELLTTSARSPQDLKFLQQIHPAFMGGNYLPDTNSGELEIARISIQSTTLDVTSVYARSEHGAIHYRVVDEYGGDTLQEPNEARTTVPMTLGEFADFFLTAWPLLDVLDMNFDNDCSGALDFFTASSDFYPQLDALCRLRVIEHFDGHATE